MKSWVKLYTEVLDDPKIGRLSWADRGFWSALLALAGRLENHDEDGNENGAIGTMSDIAWYLRCEESELNDPLKRFWELDMVREIDGIWYVVHWAKRQARYPSDTPESTRFRQRKRRNPVTTDDDEGLEFCHESVTSVSRPVTTLDKNRIDTDKREREDHAHAQTSLDPSTPIHLQPDPRPESIRILYELAKLGPAPDSASWQAVLKCVPDTPDALKRWREAVSAWLTSGNSSRNVQGMIDWFKSGKRDNRMRPPEPSPEDRDRTEKERLAKKLAVWEAQHASN